MGTSAAVGGGRGWEDDRDTEQNISTKLINAHGDLPFDGSKHLLAESIVWLLAQENFSFITKQAAGSEIGLPWAGIVET